MKISIVTISFNQAEFLKKCIDSVLSQENVEVEYIVVDPGSTDGSREIINSYGDKIIRVFEPDDGPADGLNKGFLRATGDIFGFINSDDYFLPGALACVRDYFGTFGLTKFISGSGFIERPDGGRIAIVPSRMSLLSYLYGACTVFQQGTFFPAEAFQKVNGFNVNNIGFWDGELFADLMSVGYKHEVINGNLAVFRIYPESITGSRRLDASIQLDHKRLFREKIGREFKPHDHLLSVLWRGRKILFRMVGLR